MAITSLHRYATEAAASLPSTVIRRLVVDIRCLLPAGKIPPGSIVGRSRSKSATRRGAAMGYPVGWRGWERRTTYLRGGFFFISIVLGLGPPWSAASDLSLSSFMVEESGFVWR